MYKTNDYMNDLDLLIISPKLRVSLSYEKWVQREKNVPITHAYLKG